MDTIKFFEFKNKECKGIVAVADKYSDNIENLLNAYYAEKVEAKMCTRSAHEVNLFTSYEDVDLDERLAIYEEDTDGISSGRQPKICKLVPHKRYLVFDSEKNSEYVEELSGFSTEEATENFIRLNAYDYNKEGYTLKHTHSNVIECRKNGNISYTVISVCD